MPIVYALVARKKNVLAEYTSSSGNFPTVTRVLLGKIPDQDGKMSYVYDKHIFHYIVDQGITFLCMADESMKRRVTFAFLEDIKSQWRQKYGSVEQTVLAFSLNEAFSVVLNQKIDQYNTNPQAADNISKVQAQIDGVKDVMVQNIDLVLQRGEKIELMVDKTERLNQQAVKFEKSSRNLKRTMWYRKCRNYFILAFFIVVVLVIVLFAVCGFDMGKCEDYYNKYH